MYAVILITASGKKEARTIARSLLKNRIAACVNVIEGIDSYFRWQGKIDSAREVLLIVKTRKKLIPEVIRQVKSLHSYEVPEIISLPITKGYAPYLSWIAHECRR
ncbi:MAG: divalent-cation tolerance protein CutA [Candidatus Omnitrophota bacterium]|jgi:periplasmic divalent cation tolerance protein|nr:MAG: divalent-cation tolerance protein CutA [Candidatus Omnitrophota bacterium]